jgi:hypothetical protein
MLIAAAVRLVAPERGYGEKKLAGVMQAPFAALVKDHFARLLGYSREPERGDDALGVWWREGYKLHHTVVHEGQRPSEPEAEAALGSAMQLQRDFSERLRKANLGDKLPRVPINVKQAADAARKQAGDLA